jgi:hypothetical protein
MGISAKASKLANDKYMGSEPILGKDYTKLELIKALNWYSYMYDANDGIGWVIEYMKNTTGFTDKQLSLVSKADIYKITSTTMFMCRIANNGAALDSFSIELMHTNIITAINSIKTVSRGKTVSIQDRTEEKTSSIICDFEEAIDSFIGNVYASDFDALSYMRLNQLKTHHTDKIIEYYTPILDEIENCPVGYSDLSKPKKINLVGFIRNIITASKSMGLTNKATRVLNTNKTKNPKILSSVKLTEKLNYCKENQKYKVVSINPASIIGAKYLWTFNPTYNLFTVYVAEDSTGLGVKGTTITGYSETLSVRKRNRKPEDLCASITTRTPFQLTKLIEELKESKMATVAITGRISPDVILLKVAK